MRSDGQAQQAGRELKETHARAGAIQLERLEIFLQHGREAQVGPVDVRGPPQLVRVEGIGKLLEIEQRAYLH